MKRDVVQENAHILAIGFQNFAFLYQIKAKEVSFTVSFIDWNSEMQSWRYQENSKAVSERRQEQSSVTLYRKLLLFWLSGIGILIFLFQIKVKEASFIVR